MKMIDSELWTKNWGWTQSLKIDDNKEKVNPGAGISFQVEKLNYKRVWSNKNGSITQEFEFIFENYSTQPRSFGDVRSWCPGWACVSFM